MFDGLAEEVRQIRDAVRDVPLHVRNDPSALQKAWRNVGRGAPKRGPKSAFFDPLALQYSLGFKDRRFALTFDVLKRIVAQLPILGAIVNTRVAQVAAFSQPYRMTRAVGFQIRHRDSEHLTTRSEKRFLQQLEDFVLRCGRKEPNPYGRGKRDDFEQFLRKLVRDSLIFDQACVELVPDVSGQPYEFIAVDSSTVRFASDDRDVGVNSSWHQRGKMFQQQGWRTAGLFSGTSYGSPPRDSDGKRWRYVQVINGQIENTYTEDELIFGVRNPRTDIYVNEYGWSEVEQAVSVITGLLYAETYNRNFFVQGSNPKGLLNIRTENWTPDQLEGFRRHWQAQVAGIEGAWKTPILQAEQGVEWVDLMKTNQEMEWGRWIEYLLKILSALYLLDPAEINFDLHGGVQQTPLFESSQEWKLKASRDRGLKPLLRFVAKQVNRIIEKIDDHFVFEFVGLDELTEQEKHELTKEQVVSYMTLNEVRRGLDLPDLPGGDMIMSPAYMQALASKQQEEMQQQQMMQQQQGQEQQEQQGQQQSGQEQQQGQPQNGAGPPNVNLPDPGQILMRSLSSPKTIEVTFDQWVDEQRAKRGT